MFAQSKAWFNTWVSSQKCVLDSWLSVDAELQASDVHTIYESWMHWFVGKSLSAAVFLGLI